MTIRAQSLPIRTSPSWIKRLEQLCTRWWWVLLWLLVLNVVHESSSKARKEEEVRLKDQLTLLRQERMVALTRRDDLTLQINSQSDPDWVELVLRKGLGLVPEGQVKVFFQSEP